MATVRRYAAGTTVEVSKTKGEMMELLTAHGASHTGFGTEENPPRDVVMFKLSGKHYQFAIAKPTKEEAVKEAGPRTTTADWISREWKRRWRAHLLLIKSILEFAEDDTMGAQKLLLPFVMLPDGTTVGDTLPGQLDELYTSGKMPKLLLTGG